MLLHSHPMFKIYFGDARDKLFKQQYLNLPPDKNILEMEQLATLKKAMSLESLMFLNQVHGTDGLIINSEDQLQNLRPFSKDGDFIITNLKHVGIGVMTADCLPIIFFDKRNQVIAVVHAGWKGSVSHIATKVVGHMQKNFNTKIEDLKVIFGPSAKVCCYKVTEDFLEHLEDVEFLERVIHRREDGLYFDLPLFNMILLGDLGIKKESILFKYNDCTICDNSFYSCRRQGKYSGCQMSVVCLI